MSKSPKSKKKNARAQLLAWIRALRADPPVGTRFSERALAVDLGVSTQALRNWLNGRSRPLPEHAYKLGLLTKGAVDDRRWGIDMTTMSNAERVKIERSISR